MEGTKELILKFFIFSLVSLLWSVLIDRIFYGKVN